MRVFKAVFTRSWEIWELDTEHLKRLGSDSVTDWSEDAGHYGNIYNNLFFTTRDAAGRYISKNFVEDNEIVRL